MLNRASCHFIAFAIGVLVIAVGWSPDARSQSRVAMVVADHRDPSSIPGSSEIFQNAYAKIADQLRRKGITPRRASEVPSARKLAGKIERNMALAVEAARDSNGRISQVLAVRIYVSMHRAKRNNSFYLWIDGEARSVAFGKVIAKHEQRSHKRHTVEKSCGRDCMLDRAIDLVGPTAEAFGAEMAAAMLKGGGRK